MKYFKSTALIAISILIFSCGKNDSKIMSLKKEPAQEETAIAENKKPMDNGLFSADTTVQQIPESDKKKQPSQTVPAANPDWDKKIIKTASLNLEVKEYKEFYSSLREKVRNLGGYIAQEEQSQSDYKIENSMTIKIPVDQFDNAIVQLTNNAQKINEKKITSQDVTTEVVDTKSRMEAKKQVRQRYMDLLKQAKNMEEILSVQSEINNTQEEIESSAGRIEYLSHASTFSTIDLTYYQILNSSAKDMDNPSFGTKLSNAFKTGWSWVGDLFVGLVSIWPLLFLVFAAIIFYKRTRVAKTKQV
jgi:Domain of unknown function (DUF4349)